MIKDLIPCRFLKCLEPELSSKTFENYIGDITWISRYKEIWYFVNFDNLVTVYQSFYEIEEEPTTPYSTGHPKTKVPCLELIFRKDTYREHHAITYEEFERVFGLPWDNDKRSPDPRYYRKQLYLG